MKVTLYTRQRCHLCEDAQRVIEAARARAEFEFERIDIDADPQLRRLYNDEAPVVAIDGKKAFKYWVTMEELLKKLSARS